ncbi:protein O-mannosyl-transferase TMTC3-like [Sycon ciliatum]|uniref:protein O-mannosyl-transferase TMTC3-like n=1 Tax=Sycon ciliatum TaxID=27933 RepID=UPI0031F62598
MNSELYSTKSACLAVGVFATILYLNTIGLGFCFDDDPAIVRNKDLRSSTPWTTLLQNDFWGTPMWKEGSHKSYRPLTVLTFRLNYAIHQLSSSGYHLVNAIIHGLASALFVTFSDVTFEKTSTSLMAGLVFAAHPIHTEAVAGLVGRAEGLCAIFFMLAFLAYVKAVKKNSTDWKLFLLCILFTILSVLCKELGVTVIGVCLAYDLLALQQASLPVLIQLAQSGQLWKRLRAFSARLAVILAAAMGIMALRLHIMKNIPTFLPFDNPAAFQSSPVRQLTNLYLVFVNAWLLLCPAGLLADWSMGTIPLVQGFSDQRNLLTLLTFTVLALIGFSAILGTRRRNRILVLAISILVIPFIPASNLFFSVGFTVAERILYIPSMGFSLLLGLAFENLLHRKITGKLVRVGFLGLLVLFSAKTFVRNYQWDSDFTIFSAALRVTQSNAKVYSNIGHYYQFRQQPELADKYFSQSVIVQPNDVGAWMNVAENSLVLKDRKRCIEVCAGWLLIRSIIGGRVCLCLYFAVVSRLECAGKNPRQRFASKSLMFVVT